MWRGERVRLRAPEPGDLDVFFEEDNDIELMRTLASIRFPVSREELQKQLAQMSGSKDSHDRLLVIESLDGDAVGSIISHQTNPRFGTFKYGLGIHRQHRRKGYAREAILLLLAYFFRHLRYHKAWVDVYAYNPGSIALHEALGFVQEGRLREMLFVDGAYHDIVVYGMTAPEFLRHHGQWLSRLKPAPLQPPRP